MKQYARIPHLPGSRGTPDDVQVTAAGGARFVGDGRDEGDAAAQAAAGIGPAPRGERVLVTEKLDGSCVVIARLDGQVTALGREGRPCASSRNEGRRAFAAWVAAQPARWAALREGERLICEWLALAHGVRYQLPHEPAALLDVYAHRRQLPLHEVHRRARDLDLPTPALLHQGGPCAVSVALAALGPRGHHGADEAEGVVYRLERVKDGAVLAQAKYVRPGFAPGRYLPDHTGQAAVWNQWTGAWTLEQALSAL